MITFRVEVIPFLWASAGVAAAVGVVLLACRVRGRNAFRAAAVVGLILAGYMLYFFRDPPRTPPPDPDAIVSAADGTVMNVVTNVEPLFLKTNAVRLSVFLALWDVHVNRAPMDGTVTFAQYYSGTRYFTFQEKSSLYNQHSSIVITNARARCLAQQIVGPVARRVVFWIKPGDTLAKGQSIGMMKFGSRMDLYFPADEVEIVARIGQKVRAGETIVARLRQPETPR